MTDTLETTDTHDTSDSLAEYEAQRAAQYEPDADIGTQTVEAPEPEKQEVEEQPDPARELEKARKSLQNRSSAAREAQARAAAAEQRAAELEARLAALEGKATDDPLAQLRDDDADPIGDLEAIKRHFRNSQQQKQAEVEQQQQQAAKQREVQALSNYAAPFEEDFKVANPDYDQASQHLYQSRLDELKAIYNDPDRAQEQITQELLDLISTARQRNEDPAAIVYSLAKQRGFNGKVAISNAVDKGAEQLQTIKRGQQAARTVGGGRAESSEMTYEGVMALPASQREAAFEKLRAQEQRREMMG
jgi:hypothetical protein